MNNIRELIMVEIITFTILMMIFVGAISIYLHIKGAAPVSEVAQTLYKKHKSNGDIRYMGRHNPPLLCVREEWINPKEKKEVARIVLDYVLVPSIRIFEEGDIGGYLTLIAPVVYYEVDGLFRLNPEMVFDNYRKMPSPDVPLLLQNRYWAAKKLGSISSSSGFYSQSPVPILKRIETDGPVLAKEQCHAVS